jgi:multicomponent Na+:H+ antiporter subunit A
MVKAGVFLLARVHPVLGGTPLWVGTVAAVGALTAVTGAVLAYRQTELKRILAYSTVSALGLMTLLLGIGGDLGVRAALLYLLAHVMYKGALFLVAGTVAHETGERDVTRLAGLRHAMPVTAAAAGAAALSMAGLPPLAGFLAKELMLEAVLAYGGLLYLAVAAAVVTSMFLTAVAYTVGVRPFLTRGAGSHAHVHEGGAALVIGSLLLALGGVVAGLVPAFFATPLVDAAAYAAGAGAVQPALQLWHGLTPPLALSAVSLLGGAVLAWRWRAPSTTASRIPGPERAYSAALSALTTMAEKQTALLQSGYLRQYLLITIGVTVLLVGGTLVWFAGVIPAPLGPIALHEGLLLGLILFSTVAVLRSATRLGAVAALGIVGYSVALLYVSFGAPDLAMTQFVIETLTVILFLLALQNVPAAHFRETDSDRWRDALVAGGAGVVMCGLVLLAATATDRDPISGYFLERSLEDAHGRNVVNVILVDFRGLDTMGEISVLAIAAVGVYALLRVHPGRPGDKR